MGINIRLEGQEVVPVLVGNGVGSSSAPGA